MQLSVIFTVALLSGFYAQTHADALKYDYNVSRWDFVYYKLVVALASQKETVHAEFKRGVYGGIGGFLGLCAGNFIHEMHYINARQNEYVNYHVSKLIVALGGAFLGLSVGTVLIERLLHEEACKAVLRNFVINWPEYMALTPVELHSCFESLYGLYLRGMLDAIIDESAQHIMKKMVRLIIKNR